MKKNISFKRLIIGQVFANLGDILYTVAIVSSVFTMTHSALAASLSPVIMTSGSTLAGFLTPLLIGKIALPRLLRFSQLAKTILLVITALYLQMGGDIQVYALYLLIACVAFLDGCAEPISRSLIPEYVQDDYLIKANSLYAAILQSTSIGGWSVGASLLVFFSTPALLWINVFLFSCATFCFWFLPYPQLVRQPKVNIKEQLLAGWKVILEIPIVKLLVYLNIIENIANTAWISSIILVFVKEILKMPESWWGYINSTYFLGTIIGSTLTFHFATRINQNKSRLIFYGASIAGLFTLLTAFIPSPMFVLFCSICIGIGIQLKSIPQTTMLQEQIPIAQLPQLYAAVNVINTGTFAVTSLLAGWAADLWTAKFVFVVSGLLLLLISIIVKKSSLLRLF